MLNTQPGIALQQGLQIQVRLVTDQLQFDAVALADGFVSAEGQHPEVVLEAGQVQGEVGFIGQVEHGVSPWFSGRRSEERHVGKEWRYGRGRVHYTKRGVSM